MNYFFDLNFCKKYVKVCKFWKCIQYTMYWDKTQMLTKVLSDKINGTSNALFFLLRAPTQHPYRFSPATSTNVGISSQNFLTFSFNPFATLVGNFKFMLSANSKLLNSNQDHPSKKAVFLVKSLWNSGYDNFSLRNARVTKISSHDDIYNIIRITW